MFRPYDQEKEQRYKHIHHRISTPWFPEKPRGEIRSRNKNILFSEIPRKTYDNRCNNSISVTRTLPQIITIGYMKSKLKAENGSRIKTCQTTVRQRDTTKKKKHPSISFCFIYLFFIYCLLQQYINLYTIKPSYV